MPFIKLNQIRNSLCPSEFQNVHHDDPDGDIHDAHGDSQNDVDHNGVHDGNHDGNHDGEGHDGTNVHNKELVGKLLMVVRRLILVTVE